MRTGTCTEVVDGDTIVLDGGQPRLRYSNVWAPAVDTPLGQAVLELNSSLVLGKEVRYVPIGHMHWDNESIVAEVYVGDLWVNQELRFWLSRRVQAPQWVGGIPGADNPTKRPQTSPTDPATNPSP